jgi:histone arginine demethylase JMJD6
MNAVKVYSSSEWAEIGERPPMLEPFMVRGGCASWPAFQHLSFNYLRELAGDVEVQVGRNHSRSSRQTMPLRHFLNYCETANEDDPLYLKDWHYQSTHPELRALMQPPVIFESWLNLLPAGAKPLWSWLYIGPKNSGSAMHLDVGETSAWNAVLSGCKEWVVCPPEHPISVGLRNGSGRAPSLALTDFTWTASQHAGDLIYVPGGWAHSVHNREPGIAFTENFVNESNYESVIKRFDGARNDALRAAVQLARAIKLFQPQLQQRLKMHEKAPGP